MRAQSLDEAIKKAMTIGPISEFPERLKGELKDYLAHELAKFQREHVKHKNFYEIDHLIVSWFHSVFKEEK